MKKLIVLLFVFFFISCQTPQSHVLTIDEQKKALGGKTIDEVATEKVDSMADAILFDTIGISEAPVKVINAKFFEREYSNYRSISLTYQNVSNKKINAILFRWYAQDAFGEPAEAGPGVREGFGGGFSDEVLKPSQKVTHSWSVLSRNGKTIKAWPTKVAFADGSKWKSKNISDK